jgi:hypothetical protein
MNSDERTTLVQFLDYYRSVLERKVAGLSDPQAREAAVPPSSLTLLGLLGHAAYLERYWFRVVFHGEDVDLIFDFTDDPDADLHPGDDVTVTSALDTWRAEAATGRDIVDQAASLDAVAARDRHGHVVNLRWILVHMIEEYARHCGHADLMRERIDGVTGD